MTYPVSERVGAFIIRKNAQNLYELLLFRHPPHGEEARLHIPGGGIDPGETIETALYREIYEESGLTQLKVLRKLGTVERCWLDTQVITRRHYFLLTVETTTPDTWVHQVHGRGADAGMHFSYFWHRPSSGFTLSCGGRRYLNPRDMPELYNILM